MKRAKEMAVRVLFVFGLGLGVGSMMGCDDSWVKPDSTTKADYLRGAQYLPGQP